MILGTDLSLNSTGFCLTDGVSYKFGASMNLCSMSTKQVTPTLEELYVTEKYDYLYRMSKLPGVMVFSHKRETEKPKEFIGIGQRRLRDAAHLPIVLANNLLDFVKTVQVNYVGIEDYSMASETDNLIQVVEITSIFKTNHLIRFVGGDDSKFFAIPGPKIKMFAGKGNFQKDEMLAAFCNLKDEALRATPFHQFVRSNMALVTALNKKKGRMNVLAPIGDMIDAFWIARYVKHVIIDGETVLDSKAKAKLEKKAKK